MLREVESDFTYRGQPLHPGLLREFENWLSDDRSPITVTVNVTAAYQSNEYSASVTVSEEGLVTIWLPEEDTRYAYQWLGRMGSGLHVVRTLSSSGGGSGIFTSLLFVKFRTSDRYGPDGLEKARDLLMTVERCYPLGDRDDGQIVVDGDGVTVGQSRYRSEPQLIPVE